ncbi:MAG: flagellar filament capping protein FliD [Thermodesulfobacteriota bacterium]
MAIGSLSSLGIGSNLELQSILEQLRGVDEQRIVTPLKNKVAELTTQLDRFSVVKNKLLAVKSPALSLSLASTFLGRTITSSSSSVLTATVQDGAAVQATSVTVDRLATKSSWLSGATAKTDTSVYIPTIQESTTGVADPGVDVVAASDGDLVITFGSTPTTITVPVGPTAGVETMNQLVDAINADAENVGGGANGRLVTASTYVVGTETYLRISSDFAGGTGEANRVKITTNPTSLTFAPPKEVFQYEFGPVADPTVVTLNVDADTTLAQLVDLINDDADNPGVTASIIDTGDPSTPYKLLLQADATGEDNRIAVIEQLPDLAFAEQQGAGGASLNAQVTLDGISYQRQRNTISDVITGVTMTLQGTGTSTITVASNDKNVRSLIVELVSTYNAAIQEIRAQVNYDSETKQFGPLARTTVGSLRFDLQNLMGTTVKVSTTATVTSLFDLGMEFNQDGTITLDTEVLDGLLATDAGAVEDFLLGDADNGITGFADTVNERLRVITSGTGQIEAEKTTAQERIDDLNLRIETETERLDRRYEILTKQFVELDRYMSQMSSMSSFLTSQFESLSKQLTSRK